MMKNVIIIGLLLLSIGFAQAADSTISDIDAEVVYTDPYPVEPGSEFDVSIEITNSGTGNLEDLSFELNPSLPFSLLESSTKEITKLSSSETRILEYSMFVNNDASSGTYEIPLLISSDNTNSGIIRELEISIQGVPELRLMNTSTNVTITPGTQSELTFDLKNVGTGTAKKVTATLESNSSYINPIFSSGISYLGKIDSDDDKTMEFVLFVDPSTEFGSYDGTITVTYDDEAGNSLSQTFEIGIMVSGEPDLHIIKTEVDSADNEIEIDVINSGSATALAINSKLYINDELYDTDYITQIKVDKQATIKFKTVNTEIGTLVLEYKSPDSQRYTLTEEIVWENPSSGPNYLIYVLVVILAYIGYKKKVWTKIPMKKKKK